ncbi:MAG TPA: cyclic nucleotide-binding domain-containing protein [Devosia sp.]|jgi:signal transduction histidine kinase|uniref:sensor histidine kinase n=1 Tax=Devosia sp. TaxID=1871048 RepID=UPI002DDD4BB4|nr:cyclic nucleotide-binding domain-containing protein [Devosia sp.]HEV2514422.1 cyclic nucleotide-binding domain-containing protein [Devosia sp.]
MVATASGMGDDTALIRQVPIFAELSDAEASELWQAGQRVQVAPGEVFIREGEQGGSLYIILSGAVEVTKADGEHEVTLATRGPGEFLGEMSLLEQAARTASVRATEPSELLAIGSEAFRQLLARRPEAAATLLRTVTSRLRSTEASLVQSDKLAALGTLAAGLAHELNNPAAAIQRSTGYLSEAFEGWRGRTVELSMLEMTPEERQGLAELERSIADCRATRCSDAEARRIESRLSQRLEALGIAEPWEIAPAMAAYGWSVERLEPVLAIFATAHIDPVLQWLGRGLAAQQLMEEIEVASKAISSIVKSVKSYAYLDQAPVQDVDIAMSLDDTLMILNHKLKQGVAVTRMYEPALPRIEAYAGELNQVWTNLIDNAVQAMGGEGKLEVGARQLGDEVEVLIADSGPGIPEEVGRRIFEPFFTTKAQGVGTGLGLHIAHNIVVNRHRGRISFTSRPGRTEFRIVLPLRLGRPATPEKTHDLR